MAAEASVPATKASVLTTEEIQKLDKQLTKKFIESKKIQYTKKKYGDAIYGIGPLVLDLLSFCNADIVYHRKNKNLGTDCTISQTICLTIEEYNNPENWEPTEWELKKIAK